MSFALSGIFFFTIYMVKGQNCPQNIGFEKGNFDNWTCESGFISTSGEISLDLSDPIPGRHEIIAASSFLMKDDYGDFPINSPNGSGHSIRIGNTETGTMADRVSYTFIVPDNQLNYSIIYNYAVVFFNPPNGHADFEQPKFTARAFDVTSNKYIDCGSFDFVSSSGLPGFQQSAINKNVYYKPWAPITLNLVGFAGKTIRLELTVNGCTKNRGSHFGYAYIDVNENCESPISGNVLCDPLSPLTLTAPAGFKEYYWYNTTDLSKVLGTGNTLTISPAPPVNSKYAVKILPFPGLGCPNVLYTTIIQGNSLENFNITESLQECYPTPVDLTKAIAGNPPGLKYSYFTDAAATTHVRLPTAVIEQGTYYIKATNSTGCFLIKPVRIIINSVNLTITDPPPACSPGSIDLTNDLIVAGSDTALTYSFWLDPKAIVPLLNPEDVQVTGTYYIKGTNTLGCFLIRPVNALIAELITNDQTLCNSVNLTAAAVTNGSSPGFKFTYWKDSLATISLPNPDSVRLSGTYYIKGSNSGCSKVMPVQILVYSMPAINLRMSTEATYPKTVDLTSAGTFSGELTYSYWTDPSTSVSVANPREVGSSGIYYIKITNHYGCTSVFPVTVIIHEPPEVKVITTNTFTPNKDGINDYFTINMVGEVRVSYLKIFNRWGQLIFSTSQISNFWDGTFDGKDQPMGSYYWMLEGMDEYRNQKITQAGSITLIR
ncbi:MAG TPA: gliding motility-associated C-terminal domain-containing protein [Sphingobacteriaceae bacterium]